MPRSSGHALRVELRPSPAAALTLVAAHLGAALGALALPLSPWSAWIAGGLLLPSAWRSLARHALRRGAGAVTVISHADPGGWRLVTARGERIEGCAPSSAFVHPRLIVVSFSTPRGRIPVLVPRDAADPDDARRLRLALRRVAARSMSRGDGARSHRATASPRRWARRFVSESVARLGARARRRDAG